MVTAQSHNTRPKISCRTKLNWKTMSTPFFFQVDEIGESTAAYSHYDLSGTWVPSTDPGANVNIPAGVGTSRHVSGRQWFFNRQIIEVPQRPPNALLYKTYSVYYVGGAGFYILRGDARNPPNDDVFHKLQFGRLHNDNNDDFSSYLTNAGQYCTLRVQPRDPRWARMLLPTIYHSHQPTSSADYGGLIGELPIFLALMAFTTSRELVSSVLPHMFIGGSWVQEHPWQMQQMDRRGLVVSVYTCPPGYLATPQQTWVMSTQQDLQNYEAGVYGKYFY